MTTPPPMSFRTGRYPGLIVLQAAFVVARQIDEVGNRSAALDRSVHGAATGGLHTHQTLAGGRLLLEEMQLLETDGDTVKPTPRLLSMRTLPQDAFVELLTGRFVDWRSDLWLSAAVRDGEPAFWEMVPDDVRHLLTSVFEDPGRRDSFLFTSARKVDGELLQIIGAAGEIAVLTACRDHFQSKGRGDLLSYLVHVSQLDDGAGYDIRSLDCAGRLHELEVKTTRAPVGLVEFYLTRNEAYVGDNSSSWSLVLARDTSRGREPTVEVLGWTTFDVIAPLLPGDSPPEEGGPGSGRWATARVRLPESVLTPGVPLT